MSKFSDYLKKPQSVTADAFVSICVGVVVGVAASILLSFLPFSEPLSYSIGAVFGAMTYTRARANLLKSPPTLL